MSIQSITSSGPKSREATAADLLSDRKYWFLATSYLTIHLLLLVFDSFHANAWLVGDRADRRLGKIEAFVEAIGKLPATVDLLLTTGSPGDYVYHASIFALSGKYGVLLTQIFLGFVGMTFLYLLALSLLDDSRYAAIATATYIVFPSSLEYPHLLVTEAIVNPLIIVGFYLVTLYCISNSKSSWSLYVSGLLFSVAASVRLVFLPLIFIIAVLLLIVNGQQKRRKQHVFGFVALGLFFPLLVMTFYAVTLDSFSYGPSDHSISRNLAGRVKRIAQIEQLYDEPLTQERDLGVVQFGRFVARHPETYLRTLATDVAYMSANVGMNHMASRYLELYDYSKEGPAIFDSARDRGMVELAVTVLRTSPVMAIVNILSVVLWGAILIVSVYGLIPMAKNEMMPIQIKLLFFLVPASIYAVSQLVDAVSPRHRTPLDFMIAILFSFGVAELVTHIQLRQSRRHQLEATST